MRYGILVRTDLKLVFENTALVLAYIFVNIESNSQNIGHIGQNIGHRYFERLSVSCSFFQYFTIFYFFLNIFFKKIYEKKILLHDGPRQLPIATRHRSISIFLGRPQFSTMNPTHGLEVQPISNATRMGSGMNQPMCNNPILAIQTVHF